MVLSFSWRDDLVDLGRDEDGSVVVGRSFYVYAEDDAGHRWAHDHRFLDRVRVADPELGGVWVRREEGAAEAEVEALLARIQAHVAAGGRLASAHWEETDPVYGSAAYQDLDAVGYFKARERHAAREAGEAVPFDNLVDVFFA